MEENSKQESHRLVGCVKKFLESNKLQYTYDDERSLFSFPFLLTHGHKILETGIYEVFAHSTDITIHCYALPKFGKGESVLKTDSEEVMFRVMKYFSLVNWCNPDGSFVIHFATGQIRYQLQHYCRETDDTPSLETINNIMFLPSIAWEDYGDGLLDVMFRDVNPFKSAYDALQSKGFYGDD